MAETLRHIDRILHKIILIIAEIAIVAMVIIVTMTAVLRFYKMGLSWAEEVPKLLVGLFAFLSCSMGARDHLHVAVGVIFNAFPKNGKVQRALIFLTDLVMLLCGAFMLWYGGSYCIKLMSKPGVLPMTGLRNWVQFVSIPIAGLVIVYDSILFLTGVLKQDDRLYDDPEEDAQGEVA